MADNVEEKDITRSRVDENTLRVTTTFKDKNVDISREKIVNTITQLREQVIAINIEIGNLTLDLAILDEEV